MKSTYFFLLFAFSTNLLFSQNSISLKPNYENKLQFYFSEFDYFSSIDTILSGKEFSRKYDHTRLVNKKKLSKRIIKLSSFFKIVSSDSSQTFYMICPPTEYVFSAYLNGKLFYNRGSLEPHYNKRIHYASSVLLPPAMLNYSDTSLNEIVFILYALDREQAPFTPILITNREKAEISAFFRNFFNLHMFQAFAFGSLLIGIYFFIIYFFRLKNKLNYYLWFALSNFFFVFAYSNNIFSYDFNNHLFFEKISLAAQPLWGCANICFLFAYTKVFKRIKLLQIITWIFYSITVIPLMFIENVTDVIIFYKKYVTFSVSLGMLFFFVTAIIFFKRKKNTVSFILMLTYSLAIISIIRETYFYYVLMQKPEIISLPYMIFIFDIAIFVILSYEQSEVYREAKHKSKELLLLTESLENTVKERTAQLETTVWELNKEIEIRHISEKKLAESNAMKDKFFSIVAHDLRNPFSTIKGFVDILKKNHDKFSPQEREKYIDYLENSTKKAGDFLTGLLEWSRSQMNRIEIKNEKINFRLAVHSNIELVKAQANTKNIVIENNVTDKFNVSSDKYMLNIIIRNILTNAVKYSYKEGKIIIDAAIEKENTILTITDFGIGIEPQFLPDLFSIEGKYSRKGTSDEQGTGLGLIICKDFADKIGASLKVESTAGSGSKFSLIMP